MDSLFGMPLPIQDPVIVFLLILFFFLFSPLVAHRLKLPGIIGLILSGILLGPFGLNLLSPDIGISLFGTVGLLYLMFLTGLEINLTELLKYRIQGVSFGLLTFIIPLVLGYVTSYYLLDMPVKTSLLFASIFSSHTLVSYPIISRYGLTQISISGITIAGTVITDSAALLLLTFVASSVHGEVGWVFSLKLFFYLLGIIIFSFFILPKFARWLLKRLQGESGYQFVAVLLLVFFTAVLSKQLDIEPIIGAFFAGLALNKLIPQRSPLMNRIVFIGNNLFIPFFLLSVGMLINLSALLAGTAVLIISAILIIVAILGKFLAAYVMQLVFRYSSDERNLMFGLSTSRAAATIAVVLVGYQLKLFDSDLMNVAILMILFTCLLGSIVTDKASQKLHQLFKHNEKHDDYLQPERILVPIANPNTLDFLMGFAFAMQKTGSREPIYALTVVQDDDSSSRKIIQFNRSLEKYQIEAASTEELVSPMVRIEVSVADGILRAMKEKMITKIIIGWNVKVSASNLILGSLLEKLIEKANKMLLISNIDKPLESYKSIKVFIPPDFQHEPGFDDCVTMIIGFSGRLKKDTIFFCEAQAQIYLENQIKRQIFESQGYSIREFTEWSNFSKYSKNLESGELLIFFNSRPKSISYNSVLDNIPRVLSRYFKDHSFVLVYPEEYVQLDESMSGRLGS